MAQSAPAHHTPVKLQEDVYASILSNQALMLSLFACALAQIAKIFTHWHAEKRWEVKRVFTSGGMPSSHSSAVTCLAVTCGLTDGFGSNSFAIATVLALIVMYDASGVRLHAGKQAEVLNQIIWELPVDHPVAESRPVLRDHLGHTPPQVAAGALVGVIVAFLGHSLAWHEDLTDTMA
mmetsp:Transcript_2415/g.4931  ORF Transcript_2415/g.4931 Transcript_2415/m.4931 type:complete len:178 (+) Transcript_2415:186-719(+)|eukprot:CAMPEP_0118933934 /NCGR_PEP_ID=MMETSP1169-20130426/13051_1 /TAXON_ID=36882 /ORGANISM="Pyramimonas obovata, Strain CCMP722" /LENGTH=177 /DNA_ID=CAMNT_0006876773 /DNA_START=173 /DNA_END=706 /DNA_ORIENTATION=+